jgi:hypothetical protein
MRTMVLPYYFVGQSTSTDFSLSKDKSSQFLVGHAPGICESIAFLASFLWKCKTFLCDLILKIHMVLQMCKKASLTGSA